MANQLLLEVRRETQENGHISDDLMSALHFLFHQTLPQALDLVDRKHVSHCVCPSGRELYRVQGRGPTPVWSLQTIAAVPRLSTQY